MNAKSPLPGRRIVVVGAARSGEAAASVLLRRGCEVTLSERRSASEIDPAVRRRLEASGARLEAGGHRPGTLAGADLVVLSPGVPIDLPELSAARDRGVPVWAEVELACRFLRGRLVGITGSNGKTTTTALTAHLLSSAGFDAVACGNIGVPLCSMVESDHPERWYVVELSSFQLEGIDTLRPRVAALLNLSPDHLDRHRSFESYRAAKERIFLRQRAEDFAVLNLDDPLVAALAPRPSAPIEWFGLAADARPAFALEGGSFVLRRDAPATGAARSRPILPLSAYALPGDHNISNALAALTTAWLCGARPEALAEGLRSFRPLPHRMEPVGSVAGVEFVNDSKATNVDSALKAVGSYDRPLVWILGGRDKGADWGSLRSVVGAGRVRGVVAMGECAALIAEALQGAVTLRRAPDMSQALEAACALATGGDVVLLSPACASFDLYRNYEARGDDFRARVRALAEKERRGAPAGL